MYNVIKVMVRFDRLFQLMLLLFFSNALVGQGVIFEGLSLNDALNKAKAEDKLVFVDAYTDWCGPCKQLDKTTFPDQLLGELHNEEFINIKINLEKGEGWKFGENYRIKALPTLLYLDGDGNVVHRSGGYRPAADLYLISKEAIHPTANLGYFEAQYDTRRSDPAFLKTYVILMKNLRLEGGEALLSEYLNTQKDWNNEETIPLIYEFVGIDMENDKFKYMIENKEEFYKYVGEAEVDDRIKYGIDINYGIYDDVELLSQKFMEIYPVKGHRFVDEWKLRRLLKKHNGNGSMEFTDFAISFFDKYEMNDWNELNTFAWNIYETTKDKAKLSKAMEMAQRSVELNSNFYNNDTLAAILFKLGDKPAAKLHAMQAIADAKAHGLDAAETKTLLKLIESSL